MLAQQNDPRTRFKEGGAGVRASSESLGSPPSPRAPAPQGLARARIETLTRAPANEPRRGPCQGKPTGRPELAHAGHAPLATLTKTTLGNGYLSSCIDEKRSEMRYFV
ncbi:hypothetical protein SLEP1_g58735 [Rubroshorea leprosula]|uniref:Uncharacterized protein n=1 Tax=Rubroshorea leprosula TaxID=152421 RepID=A0AAV5MTI8_9ROSI|nr:hypothetical protein SLEP1_g58735 [Rubroshorea leprosula]